MGKTRSLSPDQTWNQATLANNFIFYKVMRHNPDACMTDIFNKNLPIYSFENICVEV